MRKFGSPAASRTFSHAVLRFGGFGLWPFSSLPPRRSHDAISYGADAGTVSARAFCLLLKIHPQLAYLRFRARRLNRHLNVLSKVAQTVEQFRFAHAPELTAQDER